MPPVQAKLVCIRVVARIARGTGEVNVDILGIDVGKREMHAVLLQGDRSTSKSVANTTAGFKQLATWLRNRKVESLHACLEATGGWSEDVAIALADLGFCVSLVNPMRVKAFAQSEMLRMKTDQIDAGLIARFCRMHAPAPWVPPSPEIRMVQGLVRRYQSLVQMRTEEQNRLQAPMIADAVEESITSTLGHLDNELARVDREIQRLFDQYPPLRRKRNLLLSIPGIGSTTAARILGEMPNIAEFRDVKAVAAYAGLSPRHYESGSVRRPSRIAKTGNANLRTALYFPAISVMRFNPTLRSFANRLRERNKSNLTIIAAVMRKLLTLAYGVLKSGRAFDPSYGAS
jgi:transposase